MGLLAFAREPLMRACADLVMRTPVGKAVGRETCVAPKTKPGSRRSTLAPTTHFLNRAGTPPCRHAANSSRRAFQADAQQLAGC